jgi:4-oxalocrotonate tautomerase
MPVVTIQWLSGRSADQKAAVASRVTEIIADVGRIEPKDISVIFVDIERESWAIGGRPQIPEG